MHLINSSQILRDNTLDVHVGDFHKVTYQSVANPIQGARFLVFGQIQVDNELGYNIGMTPQLMWTDDYYGQWNVLPGTRMGENITPAGHHGTQTRCAVFEYNGTDEKIWFGLWARAYSTASQAGHTVKAVKASIGYFAAT